MLLVGVFIASFIVLLYIWLTWNYNYWRKAKIPYPEPSLFFGNVKDYALMKRAPALVYDDIYRQYDDPAVGIFKMRQPQWLIRDPAFVKVLVINEFSNFRENDIYTEPNDFFLTTNVFFTSGERWKKERAIITPALTMSKLKLFIPHMVEVTKEMIAYLEQHKGQELEAKPMAQLFTIETAMSYVYGVKCDSYKDPNSQYRKVFHEIFEPTWWNGFKFTLATICPTIGHLFKIGVTPKSFLDFYLNVVKEAVDFKKKSEVKRKDFLQFLIDSSGKDGVPELSVKRMTGLTMNIAADASETTSAALTSVIDCLIRYPEHQVKLREEIESKINSLDDINYENINSLPYLDAFISESLRIRTPVPMLEKKCTNTCEINYNGKQYRFKEGDKIALPVYSVHNDPKYFPDPNQFRPERFTESDSDPLGFTPFGGGPRMCLGRKFAYIQMKVFLCALLKFFNVLPKGDKAPPIEYDKNSVIFLTIKGGVWIRAMKR